MFLQGFFHYVTHPPPASPGHCWFWGVCLHCRGLTPDTYGFSLFGEGGEGVAAPQGLSQPCWVPESSVQLSPPSTNFSAGLGFCSLQPKPQPSPTSLTQEGFLRDTPEFAALLMHKAKGNGLAGWPAFILQTALVQVQPDWEISDSSQGFRAKRRTRRSHQPRE